jgi:hypothetical protein
MKAQEVAEFRAKCIAAVERCDDPDILEAMVCIKRLYEASQAENERLQRVVEQFTWKPISEYVKPDPAGVCPAFIGQTADGQVIECYWSHFNREFGSYGGPAEPVYFMEYPKAHLKGADRG